MGIRIALGNGKAKAFVCNHELRVTAIQRISGKLRIFTKILPARTTVTAFPAGPAQPGNANTGTLLEAFRTFADFHDTADNLVTENERQFRMYEIAVHDLEIGPADGAGADSNENLAIAQAGLRNRHFPQLNS